ncbi:unnamed protein product, partial [Mesorhabditis belari]|uniref:NTR domain-containing protein n=1 Tax=Mesorhabditis belari TaxID=2138241 RepID=A0AAF3EX21_9BILA
MTFYIFLLVALAINGLQGDKNVTKSTTTMLTTTSVVGNVSTTMSTGNGTAIGPVGEMCSCQVLPRGFKNLACALGWISKAKILSVRTIDEEKKLKEYTLKHLHVYKGDKTLPKKLIVENSGKGKNCSLHLTKKGTYLLSGFLVKSTNGSNSKLVTSTCLSLGGLSPRWNKVSARDKKMLQTLKCAHVSTPSLTTPTLPTSPVSTSIKLPNLTTIRGPILP